MQSSPASSLPPNGRRRVVGVAIGDSWSDSVLDRDSRCRLEKVAEVIDLDLRDPDPADRPVDGLITGWGTPRLDGSVLDRMPGLRVVCHAAGSIRPIASADLWSRGIRVTSAAIVNAAPVVDYTVAQIVLAQKNAWRSAHRARTEQTVVRETVRGVTGAVVGLVGLGRIGRMVAARLQSRGVTVLAHDPHVSGPEADRLGIELLSLTDLAARSEVLSLHAPLVEATVRMIGADVLDRLPDGATLINTARGALVDTDALTGFLQQRPDAYALLDVTDPEPLPPGHRLLTLPNTFITPHIAGSLGREVAALGRHAADRLICYFERGDLSDEVVQADLATVA